MAAEANDIFENSPRVESLPFLHNVRIVVDEQSPKPNDPFVITKKINGVEYPVAMLAYENDTIYLLCYSASEQDMMLIALSKHSVDPSNNGIRFNSKVQFLKPDFRLERKGKGKNDLDFLLHPDQTKDIRPLAQILPGYNEMFSGNGLVSSKPLTDATRDVVIASIREICVAAQPELRATNGKNKGKYKKRANHDIAKILQLLDEAQQVKSTGLVESNGAKVKNFGNNFRIVMPPLYAETVPPTNAGEPEDENWLIGNDPLDPSQPTPPTTAAPRRQRLPQAASSTTTAQADAPIGITSFDEIEINGDDIQIIYDLLQTAARDTIPKNIKQVTTNTTPEGNAEVKFIFHNPYRGTAPGFESITMKQASISPRTNSRRKKIDEMFLELKTVTQERITFFLGKNNSLMLVRDDGIVNFDHNSQDKKQIAEGISDLLNQANETFENLPKKQHTDERIKTIKGLLSSWIK